MLVMTCNLGMGIFVRNVLLSDPVVEVCFSPAKIDLL